MEDLRQQLLAAFEAEHREHLAAMRQQLRVAAEGGTADLRDVFRRAHSLKGAARAVAHGEIERLAHDLETCLAEAEQGNGSLDAGALAALNRLIDAIEDAAEPAEAADQEEKAPAIVSAERVTRLNIGGDQVERLGRSVTTLIAQLPGLAVMSDELADMAANLTALRALAGRSPESADMIDEGLATLAIRLGRLARGQGALVHRLDQAAATLERDAERIMLVPGRSLAEGFERMVRELGEAEGRPARLIVRDDNQDADRRVLQALRDPVMHLLRNAIGHGVEPPAQRRAAGKPAEAEIRLDIAVERGELVIVVADDGRGPDLAAIEARARHAGLIAPDAPRPSRDLLLSLMLEEGLSTATAVDHLSGRGLGLAVVAEAVRRLHGAVRISGETGRGLSVELRMPGVLSRQSVLMFEAGGAGWGLPVRAVKRLLRPRVRDIENTTGGQRVTVVDDDGGRAALPLLSMTALLGGEASPAGEDGHQPALLLDHRGRRFVLAVDALLGVEQLVVGNPGTIAADAPLVYGTLIREGGSVMLVLSPAALVDRIEREGDRLGPVTFESGVSAAPVRRQTILVVDDSITTRTLERSILEAQGYRVLLSVDGLDGLARLREESVDLVIADVEMPRMDGFALLGAIRNDPALRDIPVVMMTSRNSPDDVRRGLDLGADAYVTKQDFDQGSLLATIGRLL